MSDHKPSLGCCAEHFNQSGPGYKPGDEYNDPKAVEAELDIISAGCLPTGEYLERWDEDKQEWVKTSIPTYKLP